MPLGVNGNEVLTLSGGSASLTVPSTGNVTALVILSHYRTNTALAGFSGVSLSVDGLPDVTLDYFYEEGNTAGHPVGGWIWWNPTAGAQTLSMVQNSAFSVGPVLAVYIDDANTSIVDSGIDHNDQASLTDTLNLSVGDLVIAYTGMYAAIPDLQAGFTNIVTDNPGTTQGGRASEETAIATTQEVRNDGDVSGVDNCTLVAFAFTEAAAQNTTIEVPLGPVW